MMKSAMVLQPANQKPMPGSRWLTRRFANDHSGSASTHRKVVARLSMPTLIGI